MGVYKDIDILKLILDQDTIGNGLAYTLFIIEWKDSPEVAATLENLVKRNTHRQEILTHLNREFSEFAKRGSWTTLNGALRLRRHM